MNQVITAVFVSGIVIGSTLGQELQLKSISYEETGLKGALVELPISKFDFALVSTRQFLPNLPGAIDPTLSALGGILAPKLPKKGLLLASGGLNRADPLDPAGLLVVKGDNLAPLAYSKGKRNEVAGVLCFPAKGVPTILTIDQYRDKRASCPNAVQGGPIVILDQDPNGEELPPSEQDAVRLARLVACVSKATENTFALYFFESAKIIDVQKSLRSRCRAAINLAGSTQAGVSIWSSTSTPTNFVGSITTPLASVIQAIRR